MSEKELRYLRITKILSEMLKQSDWINEIFKKIKWEIDKQ
jgi:hypothetical protein